ncbi:hypothetical protein LCGC14_2989190 [marine sediment metagenome]|uniref:Uncharacterized protein n=1 Tax=marine sediment metagenome TaxID=412755 RepID=A0A0F8X542_9ZZZZ
MSQPFNPEGGKGADRRLRGVLLLTALILLVLVGIRVGVALAASPAEGETWGEYQAPRLTALAPAPTPSPSPTPMATPAPVPTPEPQTMDVALTFYTCPPFCPGDPMANTLPLHEGAVACGYALVMGQRFQFEGVEYICEDRGLGPYQWLDFWHPTDTLGRAWQARVGMTGTITLLGSGE